MNKEFWFKITKWNTNKPDFCRVFAKDEKEAKYKIEDQLLIKKSLTCEYFSTCSKYGRKIDNITNFEIISKQKVKNFIEQIQKAINKQGIEKELEI